MVVYYALQWYRDRGNGQSAADTLGAVQVQDGRFPLAIIREDDRAKRNALWERLWHDYGINAMDVACVAGGSTEEQWRNWGVLNNA